MSDTTPTERPPLIRLADGREVGTDTLEIARTHYPDAEWIGYQGEQRFEEARPLAEVETDPRKMNRDELNAYAAERGVADPSSFRTKADLAAAIDAPGADAIPDEATPPEQIVADNDNAEAESGEDA